MARTTQKIYPSSGAAAPDEHLRAVYEVMSCAVMVVDEGGVTREANSAACHLLGVSRADLVGQTLAAVTGASIREDGSPLPAAERPTGLALADGGAVRDVVVGLTRRDGTRYWLQVDAVPPPSASPPRSAEASCATCSPTTSRRFFGSIANGTPSRPCWARRSSSEPSVCMSTDRSPPGSLRLSRSSCASSRSGAVCGRPTRAALGRANALWLAVP